MISSELANVLVNRDTTATMNEVKEVSTDTP